MTDIRIHSLTLVDFEPHRHLSISFLGEDARVLGENGTGKTALARSFAWLLWGGTVPGEKEKTSVEAELTVSGHPLTLRRARREGKDALYIDSCPVSAEEFARRLNNIGSEEQLRCLSDVVYFIRRLSREEQLSLLRRAVSFPEDESLLSREDRFAPLKGEMEGKTTEEYGKLLSQRTEQLRFALRDLGEHIRTCRHGLLQGKKQDFEAARKQVKALTERREQLTARLFDPETAYKETCRQRYGALLEENRRYRQALESLEEELTLCSPRLRQRLEARKSHLTREYDRAKQALLEAEAALPAEDGGEEPDTLRRELEQVRQELRQLRGILDREALADYARQRLIRLVRQRRQAMEQLMELEKQERLLTSFIRRREEIWEERVNALFSKTAFRLSGEGGAFSVTWEGVPEEALGTGGSVALGMEIIGALSAAWGIRMPLFIDNAESITHWTELPCQCIRLTAVPGKLRLERKENFE